MNDYLNKGVALIFADFLSLITISSCLVIKVPQIRSIIATNSAKGISTFGLMLELTSYTIMMSYNFISGYSFLSYLEYPILLIQEYVLVYVVFKYKNLLDRAFTIGAGFYTLCLIAVYFKIIPIVLLTVLVPLCTPISATSKVLQLIEILKSKNAASISLTTWALSAFTNFTRIYTVFVESYDIMLLSNFLISFSLSMSVFLAAYYYKKPKHN